MIGILLAAGFSRRFGTSDKLMHTLPNGTTIATSAAKQLVTVLPLSIAVVRPGNTGLAAALKQLGLQVVYCAENAENMADSLVCAIHYALQFSEQNTGFVIALADMPYIQTASIRAVADALQAGAKIAIPTYHGQRGHPVGFAAAFGPELKRLSGDEGARAIVQRHAHDVVLIACDDAGIVTDIDTPTDLMLKP